MSHRFYLAEVQSNSTATLMDSQAHHALNVMRLTVGDSLTLFDGVGGEFQASIVGTSRKSVELEVAERNKVDREPARRVTIAAAIPKSDRSKWLIEKLTEVGVAQFVPLICQRSTVKFTDSTLKKFEKYVVETSKQCGRNRLMEISAAVKFEDWIQSASGDSTNLIGSTVSPRVPIAELVTDSIHIAATQSAADSSLADSSLADSSLADSSVSDDARPWYRVMVGPEGGFTDAEMESANAAGFRSFTLASSTLRIETAALLSAGVIIAV